jgi:hypothetical protein
MRIAVRTITKQAHTELWVHVQGGLHLQNKATPSSCLSRQHRCHLREYKCPTPPSHAFSIFVPNKRCCQKTHYQELMFPTSLKSHSTSLDDSVSPEDALKTLELTEVDYPGSGGALEKTNNCRQCLLLLVQIYDSVTCFCFQRFANAEYDTD